MDLKEQNMIKELKESPNCIKKIIKETINTNNIIKRIFNKNLIISGMGSSYFVGKFGELLFNKISKIKNCYSSEADEIKLNNINESDILLLLSQSGNTKEIIKLIDKCNNKNINTCIINNNHKSKSTKISKINFNLNIGKEKSPVSTKYIASLIALLYKCAINIGIKLGNITDEKAKKLINDLFKIPDEIELIFKKYEKIIINYAKEMKDIKNFYIIGNGFSNITAKEISLKIRETTGLHASYDTVGIINHGGIGSINSNSLCIVLNNQKIIQKLKNKNGKIISIGYNKQSDIKYKYINKRLNPILEIICGQLFIYHFSKICNINTDNKIW